MRDRDGVDDGFFDRCHHSRYALWHICSNDVPTGCTERDIQHPFAVGSGAGRRVSPRRLLGKSSDLTGRTDIWPLALEFLKHSGAALLGGGFGSGFAQYIVDAPIDSGYIDKIIEFGYFGSTIVFAMYVWILLGGRRLIMETPPAGAAVDVFPFSIVTLVMIINITEGLFMEKHVTTVLTAIAAGLTCEGRAVSTGRRAA